MGKTGLPAGHDICLVPDPKNDYTDRSTMIKVAEYMALAKPTVAFDLTENRRTAADAAVYAEPNDDLDFARRIAAMTLATSWSVRSA